MTVLLFRPSHCHCHETQVNPVLAAPFLQYRDDIQKAVSSANGKAESHACFVQKWRLLDAEFSIPGGELGPTLKMRRKVIMEKYGKIVEEIYSGQTSG